MLVVLNDGIGQMCNKILFQINILASAYVRDYQVTYYNMQKFPGFRMYQADLEKHLTRKKNVPKIRYFFIRGMHKGLAKIGKSHKRYVMVGAKNQKESEVLITSNYLQLHTSYLYGWPFYDLTALRKAGRQIREFMSPDKEVQEYVESVLSELRNTAKLVIGVHLRRGDYLNWRNGAYYYCNEQYKKCMDMFYENVSKGHKCTFVLFSNEKIDEKEFNDDRYKVVIISGSAAQDFHTMSKCDYLIGPPSSFSGLASFMGQVPRYMIENPNRPYEEKDMLVWLEETGSWGLPIQEEEHDD